MVLKQIGTQQWFLIKNYTAIILIKKMRSNGFWLNWRLPYKQKFNLANWPMIFITVRTLDPWTVLEIF